MSIKLNAKRQKFFFDKRKNRYKESLITNPPYHTEKEIKEIISRLKEVKMSTSVLDFGAGNGRITIPLLQNKFTVLSFDISKKSLKRLTKIATRLFSTPRLTTTIIFPKQKVFSAIVGADILHHVVMEEYLPKIHDSLKNNGIVVFSEPGGFNIAWYIYLPLFIGWEVERGVVHCSMFNLQSIFKKSGFKNIKIKGLGLLPRPLFNFWPWLCRFNDWLGNLPLLKLFAYRYIIEASK